METDVMMNGQPISLRMFRVSLQPTHGETAPFLFECLAADLEHAQEQAENAHPGRTVINILRLGAAQALSPASH